MTPRSLFNIILKVIGLFFIRDFLVTVPEILSLIDMFKSPDGPSVLWTLVSALFTLSVYWIVSYYLVFRTDLIIDKLKLDKSFDQKTIPVQIQQSAILGVATIVVGGLMVTNGIPDVCRQFYLYIQDKRMTFGQESHEISYFVLSISKIIIGILLIGYRKQIVRFIEGGRKH